MNRSELIKAVADNGDVKDAGLKKDNVTAVIGALEGAVIDALRKGENVEWLGFLKLELQHKPARMALKPGTSEQVPVAAKNVVKVTPFKPLKEAAAASL